VFFAPNPGRDKGRADSSVMPRVNSFNVLTSPPDTSAMNSVQFPLEFSPWSELNSAGLRTGALKRAPLTARGSTVRPSELYVPLGELTLAEIIGDDE
jgi:hypothetical protein